MTPLYYLTGLAAIDAVEFPSRNKPKSPTAVVDGPQITESLWVENLFFAADGNYCRYSRQTGIVSVPHPVKEMPAASGSLYSRW